MSFVVCGRGLATEPSQTQTQARTVLFVCVPDAARIRKSRYREIWIWVALWFFSRLARRGLERR